MSMYGTSVKIDGLTCGMIHSGGMSDNGTYRLLFEREFASLEQIEKINWAKPTVEYAEKYNGTKLPVGYGFELTKIDYDHGCKCYNVWIKTGEQYLGDVAGYRAEVDKLNAQLSTTQEELATTQAEVTSLKELTAQQDEALIELYEKMLEGETNG